MKGASGERSFAMKPCSALFVLFALLGPALAQPMEPPVMPPPTSIVDSIAIWPGAAPDMRDPPSGETVEGPAGDRSYSAISRPTLTGYFAANPNGAAVLVLPGGGFTKVVFDKEGAEIARWLNSLGIDAFVLKYRLMREPHNLNPAVGLQDVQRAIRLIRNGRLSASVGHPLDPKRVGVIGFSAGGNLSAVLSTYYGSKTYEAVDDNDAVSARPDFAILGYAWVPLPSEVPETMPFVRDHAFAAKVSAATPPMFVFSGNADAHVPYVQSQRVAEALQKAGVAAELHLYDGAPHGFALRGAGPEKSWPADCAAWLRARGFIPPE
jgi:acetyl esterase/lipase